MIMNDECKVDHTTAPLLFLNRSVGSFTSPSIWLMNEDEEDKASGLRSLPINTIIWTETRSQLTTSMISGAPDENIVQNHLNIALLNVF